MFKLVRCDEGVAPSMPFCLLIGDIWLLILNILKPVGLILFPKKTYAYFVAFEGGVKMALLYRVMC